MKSFLSFAVCLLMVLSPLFGQDKGNGLNSGTIFAGLSPCFSAGSNSNPGSESGSNFNSLGLNASVDYFVADNLSVGATVGGFRSGSGVSGGSFESSFTNSHVDVGLNANFYPPNCFCDGEPNDARFRPFFGVNTTVARGRQVSSFDNSESVRGFQNLRGSLSAGVLVNLKDDTFMQVEGDVLSLTNRREFDTDTGSELIRSNNLNFGLNKSLFSLNFIKSF